MSGRARDTEDDSVASRTPHYGAHAVSVDEQHADGSHLSAAGAPRTRRRKVRNEQLTQNPRGCIPVETGRVIA